MSDNIISRITYRIVQVNDENGNAKYAIIRQLGQGNFVGYDAYAHRKNLQKDFPIYDRSARGLFNAARDSKKYTLYVHAYNDLLRNGLTPNSEIPTKSKE